ncbi:MAG: hypothetical protein ACTSP9_10820 [Promethearchaeota archaeon]
MSEKRKQFKTIILSFTLISLIIFQFMFITSNNITLNDQKKENFTDINSSLQNTIIKQWIKNPTFESPIEPGWFWENGTEGDNSDMDAVSTPGQADFRVLGEELTFTLVSGVVNSSTSPGWMQFRNGNFQYPDTAEIRSYGGYVQHTWADDTNQAPSVHWKTNLSVPIDMSDYVITSSSLEIIVNATVDANVDTPNDNGSWQNFAIGDSITFYSQISDLNYNPPIFTVAENKTRYLGQQNASVPTILTLPDSPLEIVNEIDLITALNSAFDKDPDHSNITLTLGIDIYSEDNLPSTDTDTFSDVIIKNCTLSFTCRKKIDQFTKLSWNQIGNQINGSKSQITDADFNFKYKVDKDWPTEAPLSEIRFYINDKVYTEGITKLSTATTSFQEAKLGGFNVLGFIETDVNITISIEIFLKDSFVLNETIDISIDDAYLNITYIETLPDHETDYLLYFDSVDKTLDPLLEVPIGEVINLTLKFTDIMGSHLSGAEILITGDRIRENLTEDIGLQQYWIMLNTTEGLNLGANLLTIEASYPDYQTKVIFPRISVRKINTEILPTSGLNVVNINPGDDVLIQIWLNNTDYGGNITGAVVTYSYSNGDGVLTDLDNDGIYEGIIQNLFVGSHVVTISALVGDDFQVQNFQLTINAFSPPNPLLDLLVYILMGGIVVVSVGITLYQTHFKYPPTIRKIRKLKKKIRKEKKLKKIDIINRGNIINNRLTDKTGAIYEEPSLPALKEDKKVIETKKDQKLHKKEGDLE